METTLLHSWVVLILEQAIDHYRLQTILLQTNTITAMYKE